MNGELKNSNFASCIFGSSRVSGGWFCQHGDSVQRRVLKFLEKGHTWMEVESVHSAIEGKLRGRQIIWPAELHWCNNCRKKRPSLWSQTSGPHFLQRLLQAELLSSIHPGSSAGDPQVVDLRCLKYLPDGLVSYNINYTDQWRPHPKDGERTKLMTTRSPNVQGTQTHHEHQVAASSAAKESTARRLPSLLWCTASWRLDTEHRNFVSSDSKAGTPGHQRNMLSSLRIRICMVLSHD